MQRNTFSPQWHTCLFSSLVLSSQWSGGLDWKKSHWFKTNWWISWQSRDVNPGLQALHRLDSSLGTRSLHPCFDHTGSDSSVHTSYSCQRHSVMVDFHYAESLSFCSVLECLDAPMYRHSLCNYKWLLALDFCCKVKGWVIRQCLWSQSYWPLLVSFCGSAFLSKS